MKMKKKEIYKVWVSIEKITNPGKDSEDYEEASAFPVCAGEFKSVEEADDFIKSLTGQSSL